MTGEPDPEEEAPAHEPDAVRSDFYPEPAPEPADQPPTFWQTDQGRLVLVGSVASLLILCVVCVAGVVVFRPFLALIPPTVAAVVGTATPTATFTATPVPPTDTPTFVPTPTTTPTLTASATSTQVVANTPTVTLTPTRTPTPIRNLEEATVVGVVSGDTIDVMIEGVNYRVHYIMAEAPPANDPEQGTAPFGLEALEFNRRLVEGQQVQLEKDQQDTDDSGRLLRYVYVDNQMVNEALLQQGLARAILVPPNTKYGARLQQAEQTAREAGLGLWSIESSE
jgi:endonuclease YncB( thermonuclease family)